MSNSPVQLCRDLSPRAGTHPHQLLPLLGDRRRPLYVFESDADGEKPFEEFFTDEEAVDWMRFAEVGVVTNHHLVEQAALDRFAGRVEELLAGGSWSKDDLLEAYAGLLPHFAHKATGRSMDERM